MSLLVLQKTILPYLRSSAALNFIRNSSSYHESSKEQIHIALNLLCPGLGDKKYERATQKVLNSLNESYPLLDKQNLSAKTSNNVLNPSDEFINAFKEYQQSLFQFDKPENPETWISEQIQLIKNKQIPKIFIPDAKKVLNDFDFMFPIYSNSEFINKSMIYEFQEAQHEINPTFNELIELDKLNHDIKFNPLFLIGNDTEVGNVYHELFKQDCDDQEIIEWLKKLRQLGKSSITYHAMLYGKPLKQTLPTFKILQDWCFPKIVTNRHLKDSMSDGNNSIHQYLGIISLVNGEISQQCIQSIHEFTESEAILKKENLNLDLTKEQKESLEKNWKNYFRIGQLTLDSVIDHSKLNGLKDVTPIKLTKQQTAAFGYLVCLDYDHAIKFLGVKPVFTKEKMEDIVRLFNNSNFLLPDIEQINRQPNLVQFRIPIINNNRINRILMMKGDKSKLGKIIGQNNITALYRYEYFIRLAITKHLLDFPDHVNEFLLIMSSRPFKLYMENYFGFGVQFDQVFGCMSEEQKLEWTDDMVKKLKSVIEGFDAISLELFIKEFRTQVNKNSRLRVGTNNLNKLLNEVDISIKDDYLHDLGLSFIKYSYAKHNLKLSLQQYILVIRSLESALSELQLTKIGKIILDNTLDENELFVETIIDAIKIDGIVWKKRLSSKMKTSGIPTPKFKGVQVNSPFFPDLNLKELKLPVVKYDDDDFKKVLLINYYIFSKVMTQVNHKNKNADLGPLLEMVSKTAMLGSSYFEYTTLFKLKTNKFKHMLKEKKLVRDICQTTGLHQPFSGKFGVSYNRELKLRNKNQYFELATYIQMFNQYLGLLFVYHKKDLDLYIDKLVKQLTK